MFTGLVEGLADVVEMTPTVAGFRLLLRTTLAPTLGDGESLAVNGVCLTVRRVGPDTVHADVGPETARITTLAGFQPGMRVNVERAIRADARFGGHFVQGHVDGTAVVSAVRAEGDTRWLTFELPSSLAPLVVPKGSIAVDGVSLTVAAQRGVQFEVMVIPHTLAQTTLGALTPGSRVNVECDMIGKYVAAHLARQQAGS